MRLLLFSSASLFRSPRCLLNLFIYLRMYINIWYLLVAGILNNTFFSSSRDCELYPKNSFALCEKHIWLKIIYIQLTMNHMLFSSLLLNRRMNQCRVNVELPTKIIHFNSTRLNSTVWIRPKALESIFLWNHACLFHSFRDICVMFSWKMASNFQLNYNYTTRIRQICSGVKFVHIVLISCNFVGYVCLMVTCTKD